MLTNVCRSQARIKWGHDGGGGTDSPDGVASRRIVGASASVIFIFPCTIKSRRLRAIMEEVDKGCSMLCLTVGTVIRTAGILIHSQLRALAVKLTDYGCMLAKLCQTTLAGSKQTSLSVPILLLPHEWVNVSSGTAHPGIPGQRADKRLCVTSFTW